MSELEIIMVAIQVLSMLVWAGYALIIISYGILNLAKYFYTKERQDLILAGSEAVIGGFLWCYILLYLTTFQDLATELNSFGLIGALNIFLIIVPSILTLIGILIILDWKKEKRKEGLTLA